jgi:cell division protease FtsH
MNGKPPRPPKDWTPSLPKTGGPSTPVNPDGAPAAA